MAPVQSGSCCLRSHRTPVADTYIDQRPCLHPLPPLLPPLVNKKRRENHFSSKRRSDDGRLRARCWELGMCGVCWWWWGDGSSRPTGSSCSSTRLHLTSQPLIPIWIMNSLLSIADYWPYADGHKTRLKVPEGGWTTIAYVYRTNVVFFLPFYKYMQFVLSWRLEI